MTAVVTPAPPEDDWMVVCTVVEPGRFKPPLFALARNSCTVWETSCPGGCSFGNPAVSWISCTTWLTAWPVFEAAGGGVTTGGETAGGVTGVEGGCPAIGVTGSGIVTGGGEETGGETTGLESGSDCVGGR
jgi:hypothetical protein